MTLADLLPADPDPDTLFEAFSSWTRERGLELYPAQEEALIEVVSGANVILSTPTGSGKSLVAVGAHFTAMAHGARRRFSLARSAPLARMRENQRKRSADVSQT